MADEEQTVYAEKIREDYPEPVRAAADYLASRFEDGYQLPMRMRFDGEGKELPLEHHANGSFICMIPDVQSVYPGQRDENWPWDIYANHLRMAYNAQL